MDIALFLSSVTTLAAIVSPAVTAHINNRAAYKQQSAQLFFNAKADAYKKFLEVASSVTYPLTTAEFQNVRSVYSHTLLFSNVEVEAAIGFCLDALSACSSNASDMEINNIADAKSAIVSAMQRDLSSFQ